jgi:hypothetical protein
MVEAREKAPGRRLACGGETGRPPGVVGGRTQTECPGPRRDPQEDGASCTVVPAARRLHILDNKCMSTYTTVMCGTTRWRNANGKLHRDGDLPAVVWANGSQEWYQHGLCHRDGDLPAAVWPDRLQAWYHHGQLHRDGDLPAVVWSDGHQEWYQRGLRHRDGDLPAAVWRDGHQEWWKHGKKHRELDLDWEKTRMVLRWSPVRAAFVGAVVQASLTFAHAPAP